MSGSLTPLVKFALGAALAASTAFAAETRELVADAVAVRFHAPDIGGATHPHFLTRRQVSFEARLLALEEDPAGVVQQRHVRTAIEANVAEEILQQLPQEHPADAATIARVIEIFRAGTEQRASGRAAVEHAEKLEGIAPAEFEAMLRRKARAAIYLDRSVSPFLTLDEDELREKYRTTSHPFRGRRFEDIRDELSRWLVIETFRAAEQAFFQSARSRVTIVYF